MRLVVSFLSEQCLLFSFAEFKSLEEFVQKELGRNPAPEDVADFFFPGGHIYIHVLSLLAWAFMGWEDKRKHLSHTCFLSLFCRGAVFGGRRLQTTGLSHQPFLGEVVDGRQENRH